MYGGSITYQVPPDYKSIECPKCKSSHHTTELRNSLRVFIWKCDSCGHEIRFYPKKQGIMKKQKVRK